jgi:hypothetical protein
MVAVDADCCELVSANQIPDNRGSTGKTRKINWILLISLYKTVAISIGRKTNSLRS